MNDTETQTTSDVVSVSVLFLLFTLVVILSCVSDVVFVFVFEFLIVPSVYSSVYFVLCVRCCQCLCVVPSVYSSFLFSFVLCIRCCQCLWVVPSVYPSVYFVLCFVYPMLSVSLCCSFCLL